MITEIGHFSLILALCVAVLQAVVPLLGRDERRPGPDRLGAAGGADAVPVRRGRVPRADARLCRFRFLGRECRGELEQHEAADLQNQRRVEQPRGLDAVVGVHPRAVRRGRRGIRPQSAAASAGARSRGAGDDRRRVSLVHPVDIKPVRAAVSGAAGRVRAQPDPAGPRSRVSSAVSLSRLCRVLDRVLLRGGGADRGPGRSGLGALGAAVDAGGVVRADNRHRDGQLVVVLHARLGRLVVLGPGRERLVHAVAGRHRAAAFGGRRREARRVEDLDCAAGDPGLLAEPASARSWCARAC